jgi:ATP-binding cassette subfamily B protein
LAISVVLASASSPARAAPAENGHGQVALDAPQVLQRGPRDCGPAALQAVLEGFRIHVEYQALVKLLAVDPREGASIDTIEAVANRLGVRAEQIMLPLDHLFLSGTYQWPAIIVAKASGGLTHFLVLWRTSGERVQIMDPATGVRAWIEQDVLQKRLYVHQMAVPSKSWTDWSHGVGFHGALLERMRQLGMRRSMSERLWAEASSIPSPRGLEALDAAVRFAAAGPAGTEAAAKVQRVFECSKNPSCVGKERAPAEFWSAWDAGTDNKGDAQITVRGVVLVVFSGRDPAIAGRN